MPMRQQPPPPSPHYKNEITESCPSKGHFPFTFIKILTQWQPSVYKEPARNQSHSLLPIQPSSLKTGSSWRGSTRYQSAEAQLWPQAEEGHQQEVPTRSASEQFQISKECKQRARITHRWMLDRNAEVYGAKRFSIYVGPKQTTSFLILIIFQ